MRTAADDVYIDLPSPFGLSRPSEAWCRALADFDRDLRIFPSQKQPVFRLMRLARVMGRMNLERFRAVLKEVHPDTKIALERGLVAVFTLPAEVATADPQRVIAALRRRDQWPFRDGDAVTDAIEKSEQAAADEIDRRRRLDIRDRMKGAKTSLQYRLGARVSLVSPRRHLAGAASPPTTGGPVPPAAAVSATE